jgi:integrase
MAVCQGCGNEDRIWRRQCCFACNLALRVYDLLAGPGRPIPDHLSGLRAVLVATASPRAVLRWLDNPAVESVLTGLGQGDLSVSHDSLDAMGSSRQTAYLRQVLVTAGVLPERDETVAALQAWVDRQLQLVDHLEDRNLVAAYATWWVIRRRRNRQTRRPTSDTGWDHLAIARAIELLAWLRAHHTSLQTCTQADIDLWLASGPPVRRHARRFIRWARRQRLCGPIDIPHRPDAVPVATADIAELAATARRLLNDPNLALADRVAGLLAILYAQPLSRIAALQVAHIAMGDQVTTLQLGATPVELPEPLGQLVRQLAATRHSRAALAGTDSPWLFPGVRPGRPMHPARLQNRLGRLGIRARAARTTMLLELAGELAPTVIADTLGLYPNTAVRWVKAAAGDWNAYAAARARSH